MSIEKVDAYTIGGGRGPSLHIVDATDDAAVSKRAPGGLSMRTRWTREAGTASHISGGNGSSRASKTDIGS